MSVAICLIASVGICICICIYTRGSIEFSMFGSIQDIGGKGPVKEGEREKDHAVAEFRIAHMRQGMVR